MGGAVDGARALAVHGVVVLRADHLGGDGEEGREEVEGQSKVNA